MKSRNIVKLVSLALLAALLLGGFCMPAVAAPAIAAEADVNDGKPVKKIRYEIYATEMLLGQKLQFSVIQKPSLAWSDLKWESSNPSVLTVNKRGWVKAVGLGKAKITATTTNNIKDTIEVKVRPATIDMAQFTPGRYQYFRKYMSDSQFKQVYDIAFRKVVMPIHGMPLKYQLLYMTSIFGYLWGKVRYSMEDRHYNDPYGFFVLKVSSCAGSTRAAGFCLSMMGIPYVHVNENKYTHQWLLVKVGNKYCRYDF